MMTYLSPLFQKLFEAYDQECEQVYPGGTPAQPDKVLQKLQQIKQHPIDRALLVQQLLEEQNRYGCSPETAESIAMLKYASSGVVVTGQQPSILGGPLMILYKALTAISLAKDLSEKHGVSIVPLFWIAGDDSDLKECNFAEDLCSSQSYSLDFTHKSALIQMSHRLLDTARHNDLVQFINAINPASLLKESIAPGISITDIFGKYIQTLLGSTGLILVDGASDLVQQLGRRSLQYCIDEHSVVEERLRIGEKALHSLGEQSPVEIRNDVVRAFEIRMGERSRISADRNIRTIGGDTQLSHDVLSRPLVCDSIFPVVAHVLGPAELRYFGVLAPLFSLFGLPFPMVYPRAHATVYLKECEALANEVAVPLKELKTLRLTDIVQRIGRSKVTDAQLDEPLLTINRALLNKITAATASTALERSLDHQLEMVVQRIQKKLAKRMVSQNRDLNDQIHCIYRWLGSARNQERHLLWPTLERFIPFEEYIRLINPLELNHQHIKLEASCKV